MERPAEFDRERALDRATQAFWERRYCSTSMAKHTEATEPKPGSRASWQRTGTRT
jgi:hypothetical protein